MKKGQRRAPQVLYTYSPEEMAAARAEVALLRHKPFEAEEARERLKRLTWGALRLTYWLMRSGSFPTHREEAVISPRESAAAAGERGRRDQAPPPSEPELLRSAATLPSRNTPAKPALL